MFPAFEVLEKVRATNSSLAKDSILKALPPGELLEEVKRALFYGRNSYLTYNVKKLNPYNPSPTQQVPLSYFWELLDKLDNNTLSGNAALNAIGYTMAHSTKGNAAWLESIVTKNIDVGMGASSINKVFKGLIPVFDVQLAFPIADYWHKVTYPTYVEEKHNGLRMASLVHGENFRATSRQGKDFLAGDAFKEAVMFLAPGENFMVDGEVKGVKLNPKCKKAVEADKAGKSWEFIQANSMLSNQSTTLAEMREYCAYFIWDVVDYDYFMCQGKTDTYEPLKIRKIRLKKMFDKATADLAPEVIANGFIRMCDTHVANSKEEVRAFRDWIISKGGEGAMVKDPERPYDCTRSISCLKDKQFYPCDMLIVGAIEGKGHSKGTLGALELEAMHPTLGMIRCKCGTGWDDAEATKMWSLHQGGYLVGLIAEIEYHEITVGKSLLFPSFEHLREDKTETSFY